MDRQLNDLEVCNQMMVVTNQRQAFIDNNTSPMPDWEHVGGEWIKVHRIRYAGIMGGPNRFSL